MHCVCSDDVISQMQHRSLLGEVLMSTPDLGPPTHYIPTFYQQSTFITLQRDAIVSKIPMENNAHLLFARQNDSICNWPILPYTFNTWFLFLMMAA